MKISRFTDSQIMQILNPLRRNISVTGEPASPSFKNPIIYYSVNRLFFI
jgi:hypothetical protein